MTTHHPAWCDPTRCTIDAPAQLYRVPREHRSTPVVIGDDRNTVCLSLVETVGGDPELVVHTSVARAGGVVHLDLKHLSELERRAKELLHLAGRDN